MPDATVSEPFTRRRQTLIGLTLCCVVGHAAVLGVAASPSLRPQALVSAPMSVRSIDVMPVVRPPAMAAADVLPQPTPKTRYAPPKAVAPVAIEELAPTHLAAEVLDMPPMPRSAPDAELVEGITRSGMPIRLRLYIEADGAVSDIELQFAQTDDEPAAQRLAEMFRSTGFLPGRLYGRDVASFLDIEIDPLQQPQSARTD